MQVKRAPAAALRREVLAWMVRVCAEGERVKNLGVRDRCSEPPRDARNELDRVALCRSFIFDASQMERLVSEHFDRPRLRPLAGTVIAVQTPKLRANVVADSGVVRRRRARELDDAAGLDAAAYVAEAVATHRDGAACDAARNLT